MFTDLHSTVAPLPGAWDTAELVAGVRRGFPLFVDGHPRAGPWTDPAGTLKPAARFAPRPRGRVPHPATLTASAVAQGVFGVSDGEGGLDEHDWDAA